MQHACHKHDLQWERNKHIPWLISTVEQLWDCLGDTPGALLAGQALPGNFN